MWIYKKALQFPVKIRKPDANLAKIIITQFGGANSICLYQTTAAADNCQTISPNPAKANNIQHKKTAARF